MSEGWNIAVLGATGAVGEALLETLAERQFPVGEIFALARNDSAGEHLRFGGKSVIVKDAAEFDWTQAQLAFFAMRRRSQCSVCRRSDQRRVSGYRSQRPVCAGAGRTAGGAGREPVRIRRLPQPQPDCGA